MPSVNNIVKAAVVNTSGLGKMARPPWAGLANLGTGIIRIQALGARPGGIASGPFYLHADASAVLQRAGFGGAGVETDFLRLRDQILVLAVIRRSRRGGRSNQNRACRRAWPRRNGRRRVRGGRSGGEKSRPGTTLMARRVALGRPWVIWKYSRALSF